MTIIIKIPYERGCLNKNIGCSQSVNKIMEVLKYFRGECSIKEYLKKCREGGSSIEDYLEEKKKKNEIFSIPLKDIYDDKEAHRIIEEYVSEVLKNDKRIIIIGGDHSISYSTFKALSRYERNKKIGLVVFDAHADCMKDFDPPTHESWLRSLVEDGHINPRDIYIIGLRNVNKSELNFLYKYKLRFFTMDILFNNMEDFTDTLMSNLRRYDRVYLSIDIDVLDPAFAPATGYTEPGGLSTRELLYMVKKLTKLKNLKSIDIVEINSEKDSKFDFRTCCVGAKIIREFI